MRNRSEIAAWSRLVAGVLDEVVIGTTYDVHRRVTDGGFRWVGPLGRPVQRVHDGLVDRTYAGVRGTVRTVANGVDALSRSRGPASEPGGGRRARAIAHGVLDSRYLEVAPELDQGVEIVAAGEAVALDPAGLAVAYPDATERIVVLLHGLVDTEQVWSTPAPDRGLMTVIADAGATPVLVRYGTGRQVLENGADLADRLENLVGSWPTPVSEIILVGHSMGGLVARAATATASQAQQRWVSSVTDLVYLGTPHLGSWLERFAVLVTGALRHSSPYASPFGGVLDGRSGGIKDLGRGLAEGSAADAWLADATHHLVVGRMQPRERHPVNLLVGDGLVRASSASPGAAGPADARVRTVAARHGQLPRDPEVAALLTEILTRG